MILRNALLSAVLLFTGMVHSLQAQPGYWNPLSRPAVQPKTSQTFKAGDYVDAQFGDHWIPCILKEPVWYGGAGPCEARSATCTTIGSYIVTCTANASGPQEFPVRVMDVRARAGTADLARQPHGNTIGAKYGTRDPRTCASRTAPARGGPSAEQARQYVICELEQADGIYPISLVAIVRVQVGQVSHSPDQLNLAIPSDFDPREQVWDIRGVVTSYSCTALGSLIASNDFARTHNCSVSDLTADTGICYKNSLATGTACWVEGRPTRGRMCCRQQGTESVHRQV